MKRYVGDGRGREGGRTAGTPNKVTHSARSALEKLLLSPKALKQMAKDLEQLTPFQRLQIQEKLFSYKEVLIMGVATAIDALASGVALHSNMSNNVTIWLHVSIILVITFVLSFIGVILGKQIVKLFKLPLKSLFKNKFSFFSLYK